MTKQKNPATEPPPKVVSIMSASTRRPAVGKAYAYPKHLLWQDYFCKGGDGSIHPPSLDLKMLANPNWHSPLAALLEELKRAGHDVQGALIEYRAFVEGARAFEQDLERLGLIWRRGCPTVVRHMLESS